MPEGWTWDETLFLGSAPYYRQGRPPYAPTLAATLRDTLALDGQQRVFGVEVVRGVDVDHVDRGVVHQSVVPLVCRRDAVPVGELARPATVAGALTGPELARCVIVRLRYFSSVA